MDTIQKIERYIESEKNKRFAGYQMSFQELNQLWDMAYRDNNNGAMYAIYLAFDYGRAKGYRAAKAEMRAKK